MNCCLLTAAGETALCPSVFKQLVNSGLHLRQQSSSVFIHILDKIKVNHFHDLLSAEKNLYISFLQRVQSPAQGSKNCQGDILLWGGFTTRLLAPLVPFGRSCLQQGDCAMLLSPKTFSPKPACSQWQVLRQQLILGIASWTALFPGNHNWFVAWQEESSAAVGLGTVRQTEQESTGC